MPTANPDPPPMPIAASAGSLALDPVMRAFLESRWRACWSELRQIAPLLGWAERLPQKVS